MPKFNVSSCTVQKLDGEDIIIDIKGLLKGQDLLDEVCKTIGVEDHVYFGLRYTHPRDEKTSWFDTNKPLKKQLQKASHKFRFGVQFYPTNLHEIKHDFTRYQFVLQAREHFLTGEWSCTLPTQALLASYIAQAEFGNYDADIHEETYLNDLFFIPQQADGFKEKVCNFHQKHTDLSASEVDFLYLENAQKTGLYGMELYDIWDKDHNIMKFGITTNGIHILHANTILHTFLWPSIDRCMYKKKEIIITLKVGEKTVLVMFSTSSRTEAKRIMENCVLVKFFSLNGKRKIVKRRKSNPPSQHDDDGIDNLIDKPFSRVDSKRFSKRFIKREDSLTLDLSSNESTPISGKKITRDSIPDSGDVYLGYPSHMTVPTITQTAPSEQSFSFSDEDKKEEDEQVDPLPNQAESLYKTKDPEIIQSGSHSSQDYKGENVEVIEVVDIEYVTPRNDAAETNDESIKTEEKDEVTSKIVEIKIITTECESDHVYITPKSTLEECTDRKDYYEGEPEKEISVDESISTQQQNIDS